MTPAFSTVGGRWDQDRYGLVALKSPIPALHEVQNLADSPPDSETRHLLFTELVRQRNRLSDALSEAAQTVETILDRV